MLRQNTFLRYALLADAVASGATGLMMIAGAGLLEGLLGLPVALMREAGLCWCPMWRSSPASERARRSRGRPCRRSSRSTCCGSRAASACW